jgi:prophage tail gpP-like protein
MSNPYRPGDSNQDRLVMVFPDVGDGVMCSEFVEYEFNSHFLTATDGFSFVLDSKARATTLSGSSTGFDAIDVMEPGTRVELHLNDSLQCTGYIDSVEVSAERGGGHTYHVQGRDSFSQIVDACADPELKIADGTFLEPAIFDLLEPFGFEEMYIDNDQAREIKSTDYRAKTRASDAKGFGRKAVRQYKAHETRPYPREGVFEFASRLSQRAGLWLWPSPDGKKFILARPDFKQEPKTTLQRTFFGELTNVLSGSVKFDVSEQPTAIVADTYSKGGEFGPGRAKVILQNRFVHVLNKPEDAPWVKYLKAGAKELPETPAGTDITGIMIVPRHRVVYMHDDESATSEQLEAFVRREMALFQRKSVVAKYTVEGHGQLTPSGYHAWTVDTTVQVKDEAARFEEVMWVLSRTFKKSRDGGTTTDLDLIRLGTLLFTDTGGPSPVAKAKPKRSWLSDPLRPENQ